MSFIADHQTASVLIGLVGLAGSVSYIAWRLSQGAPAASSVAPATAPKPTSYALGQAEHERAGHAKTVKVAQVKPTHKDIPTEKMADSPRTLDHESKVQRMADLGFHAGVERQNTPAPSASVAEATVAADLSGAVPAERGQTAELDDILSRIDKVLAENPVLATNTMVGATDTAAGAQPDTATVPRPKDTDGGQQKLF